MDDTCCAVGEASRPSLDVQKQHVARNPEGKASNVCMSLEVLAKYNRGMVDIVRMSIDTVKRSASILI